MIRWIVYIKNRKSLCFPIKKISYICLLVIISLVNHVTFAGETEIDSLLQQVELVKTDTAKVTILNKISELHRNKSNYTVSIDFANQAKELAEAKKFKKGIADSYNNIGIAQDFLGNYYEALNNYSKALEIRKELNSKMGIAACYNNIGIIFHKQSNYPKALENYIEALKIYIALDQKRGKAACYTNIGHIYYDKNNPDFEKALENYQNALKIYEEIGFRMGIRTAYQNIGSIYDVLGDTEKVLESFQISGKISEEIGDIRGVVDYYINIGNQYRITKDYKNSLESYNHALSLAQEIGYKDAVADCYLQIGQTNLRINQPHEAKRFLSEALDIYLELGSKSQIKYSYKYLSQADSILGNLVSSIENYKLYKRYNDSIYNEENTEKLAYADIQFEFDKKILADSLRQVQLNNMMQAKLGKQKAYTWSGISIAFILVVLSTLIIKSNKKITFERKRSDDLLLNILPEEVSEELKEKGATTANQYDNVTVLFTDFINFTEMSKQMNSQELVDELDICFKAFDKIISRNKIEKIKTIGDTYMAVGGLPKPIKNHAQNVVKAALEIRDFMQQRKIVKGKHSFDIRLGVHSGSVVAGVVGVKKFAYDIWGDTVNTAARMEQNSEVNKVNISAATHELIKDKFHFEYRGKIEAKNKGELEMYFVER